MKNEKFILVVLYLMIYLAISGCNGRSYVQKDFPEPNDKTKIEKEARKNESNLPMPIPLLLIYYPVGQWIGSITPKNCN